MNEDAERTQPLNGNAKRRKSRKIIRRNVAPNQSQSRLQVEGEGEKKREGEGLLLRGRMPAQVILIACHESGINR